MAGTARQDEKAPPAPRPPSDADRARNVRRLVEGAEADHQDQAATEPAAGESTTELEVATTDAGVDAAKRELAEQGRAEQERAERDLAEIDAQVRRFGRLARLPRHVRDARDLLTDAEAAERLGELLALAEIKIDGGESVPAALVLRFEAAVDLWKRDRRVAGVA